MSPSFGRALADSIDPSAIDVFAKLKYKPTPKQLEFHQAEEYDVVFGGSRGSGKSLAVLMDGISRCVHVPGLRALALRKTYPELRQTLLMELARHRYAKQLGARWNGSDFLLSFPNGSVLQLGYLDALTDVSRYQGTSWGLILVDELTLMLPAAVEILARRSDRATRVAASSGSGAVATPVASAIRRSRSTMWKRPTTASESSRTATVALCATSPRLCGTTHTSARTTSRPSSPSPIPAQKGHARRRLVSIRRPIL